MNAACEMESVDKKYVLIKALRIVIDEIEKALKEIKTVRRKHCIYMMFTPFYDN